MVVIEHDIYNLGGKEVIYANLPPALEEGDVFKLNGLEREVAKITLVDDMNEYWIIQLTPLFA